MAKKDKRLWIDGCMGSELKDTQGETLSVEGADISDLEAGKGRWNDNHGKGFFNSLGVITEAKKIMKADDCENDRHKYYWDKIKAPYIYGKGYLHNDEDHPNARAAAAIIRNVHKHDSPLKIKLSVEGGVISRGISDPSRLARTKIHSCAVTFTPANNATLCEPLNLDKSSADWEADKQLINSVMHLAETNVPSFRHIERHASANTIYENVAKIQELAKALDVDVEIVNAKPEQIMKTAVYHKINSNINKIHELIKGASDRYVQNIGSLKNNPVTPTVPKDTSIGTNDSKKVLSGKQFSSQNVFKQHASKAMRDPKHLTTVISSLKDRGVDQAKIDKVLNNIRGHMVKSDDMEKGEIKRAAKNLAVATAMTVAAHQMSPSEIKKQPSRSPSSKEEVVAEHNSRVDPDIMLNAKEYGYDERKPGSKKKFLQRRRKKLKDKMKKALMAGYGGSGAPTSLTGGGVIQAESLEGDKSKKSETTDGFSYITCDNCGHEQVYMSHQVKCRDCNKNFPLSKLEDLM